VKILTALTAALLLAACDQAQVPTDTAQQASQSVPVEAVAAEDTHDQVLTQEISSQVDRFADVQVLSYEVPGFDELPLQEKKLAYYLSQAALAGRDIFYDQNYQHNLRIRKLLATIVASYSGDRSCFLCQ
jgi:dipeptidyl-peptidase-3